MKTKDMLQFIGRNVSKNKSRLGMTILATAMGCTFLIVLASVGFGLHDSVVTDITENRIVNEINVFGYRSEDGGYRRVNENQIELIEQIEGVKAVTRRSMVQQSVRYELEDLEAYSSTIAVHLPAELEAGFDLMSGRLPENMHEVIVGYHFVDILASMDPDTIDEAESEAHQRADEPEQNIGGDENSGTEGEKSAADVLAAREQLLGQTMRMEITKKSEEDDRSEETTHIEVTIVGVGSEPAREWIHDQRTLISEELLLEIEAYTGAPGGNLFYEEFSEWELAVQDGVRYYDEVHAYAQQLDLVEQIVQQLDEQGFATYSIANELDQINTVFAIAKAGLVFIGTIAVLIASIGIYNTMTMAVTERAQDIGIMKAIGMKPSLIKRLFLLESSLIGLAGALFGTVVAYMISIGVNQLIPLVIEGFLDASPPENLQFSSIPLLLTVICILISVGTAVASGLRPAAKATRVDVLQAMRRDI